MYLTALAMDRATKKLPRERERERWINKPQWCFNTAVPYRIKATLCDGQP